MLGLAVAALALWLSLRNRIGARVLVFASGVGFAVALGWVLTFTLAQVAFEPISVTSATFSGPSANTLMFFLTADPVLEFRHRSGAGRVHRRFPVCGPGAGSSRFRALTAKARCGGR